MPQFTQWNVPDPFPNILYNPAAVDAAIAKTQSELGNLDIERQKFGLEKAKFDRGVTEGEGYIGGSLSGAAGTPGAGTSVGPLADAAPDQSRDAAGQASYAFWVGKGLAPHQAAGMAAQEVAESGGRPHVVGDGGDAIGLYQHHAPRRALILANTGIDMTKPDANAQREGAYWELMNAEHGARQRLFASKDADEAGRAATEFERPDFKRRAIIDAERGRDARRIFMLANPNGAASVATATVDPRAGPRVGLTPPPAVATVAPPTAPGVNPNAAVQIPPPAVDPNARVEADDPNTAAVKQASAALLNMPEPDAAAAYPAVVRELQARGFAMNAPPTYPGHAALQALVGGGEPASPAVAQTKTAMRLNGTDVAGPPGVVPAPPEAQPNRMAYGTGLPGVTIGLPTNGLAPPPQATAPVVTAAAAPAQAQPQAASPQTQPPPAPSRAIQREPLLSNNLTASQQDAARRAIRAGTPLATVQAHVEQWKQENVAARHQDAVDAAAQQQQDYDRRRQYQQDQIAAATRADTAAQRELDNRRNAAADARAEVAAKNAGLPPGYRLSDTGVATRIDGLPPDPQVAQAAKDDWDKQQRNLPFQGTGTNEQNRNILIEGTDTGKVNTTAYKSAYADFSMPKTGDGGVTIHPDMTAYRLPEDKDGNPITTYGKAHFTIGPGDITKLRAYEQGAAELKTALDVFADKSRKASFFERNATAVGQPTELSNAWTNAALLAKGDALYQLGVLSGPDMTVIRGALADPSTFMGRVTSNETIDKQVASIKKLLETRLDQARQIYGSGMSPGGGSTPASPAATPPKAERPPLSSFAR